MPVTLSYICCMPLAVSPGVGQDHRHVDPDLLAAVDAHVAAHPELDRGAVIDEALRLWRAREVERAMEAQFAQPDGVDPAERQAWDAIRRAAARRHLGSTR